MSPQYAPYDTLFLLGLILIKEKAPAMSRMSWREMDLFGEQIVTTGLNERLLRNVGDIQLNNDHPIACSPSDFRGSFLKDYYNFRRGGPQGQEYLSEALEQEEIEKAMLEIRYLAHASVAIQDVLWGLEIYFESSLIIDMTEIIPQHCAVIIEALDQYKSERQSGLSPGETAKILNYFSDHKFFPKEFRFTIQIMKVLCRHQGLLRTKRDRRLALFQDLVDT